MNLGANFRINKCGWLTLILIIFLIIYLRSDGTPTSASELVSLKSLLTVGILAAELGGKVIVSAREHGFTVNSKGKTVEGANDPVTSADFASNCAMYSGLKTAFPKVRVVSEEDESPTCGPQAPLDTSDLPPQHKGISLKYADDYVYAEDVTVWIDPLDATQEYTEKLDEYVTTMVCVAIKGVPVIGVVHFPFSGLTLWGWNAIAHSPQLRPVTPVNDMKANPRVIVSRSHQGDVKDFARKAFGDKINVTAAGGAGYKVLSVARGDSDVYLHTTAIKKWDICAGNAIINSLDGRMTTLKGDNIGYAADSGVKNSDGLLVTLRNHDYYLHQIAVST